MQLYGKNIYLKADRKKVLTSVACLLENTCFLTLVYVTRLLLYFNILKRHEYILYRAF